MKWFEGIFTALVYSDALILQMPKSETIRQDLDGGGSWFAATVVPYFMLALIIHHCFNQLLLGTQQGARRMHNAGSQGASECFVTGKQSVAHYKTNAAFPLKLPIQLSK